MRRFEYKVAKLERMSWFSSAAMQDALLELLAREGRSGWRLAPAPPNLLAWRSVLLEREVAP